jgi:hypothetical protein
VESRQTAEPETEEDDVAYWYNIQTKQVETDENRSRNDDVMGPYETEAEASNAIAAAHENTEKWDAEDRAWEGEDTED